MKIKISQNFKKHIFSLFLCAAIFLLFSLTVFAKETDFTITDLSATATISTDTLNVRSGPGKDYDSIGKISSDDTILITGQASTGWYQIDYSGKEGYISDSYVTITNQESAPQSSEYIEGDSQKEPVNYVLLIVIAVILIIIVTIIITIVKAMTGNRNEEEEDSEEEDTEDECMEEDIEEDVDEEDYAKIKTMPKQHNALKQVPPSPPHKSATIVKDDDYRIYIDPIYFKDDITTSPPSDADSPKTTTPESDKELENALSKLNELQQEIERLKDKRK